MNGPLLLTAMLALVLAGWALAGPAVLTKSASTLSRAPRTAIAFLLLAGGLWLAALTTLALVTAWAAAGPALLPGRAADVCQRCIQAANPFELPTGSLIPPGLPLLVILLLAVASVARASHQTWRLRSTARHEVAEQLGESETIALNGHAVHLIEDVRPRAFSLPTPEGGIVISRGALSLLGPSELAAVLEHEAAHLRQRHHLLSGLVRAWFEPLTWIPLFATIVAAVPHYLELAADDASRRRCGTTALAHALLLLGAPHESDRGAGVALHAAGRHRIRHLVAPEPVVRGVPALGLGLTLLSLVGGISLVVTGLYATTIVAGCAL